MHMPSRSIMGVVLVARVTFLTCFPVFRGGYISSSYWLIISERVWLRNCQSWVEHISMGVCKVCQSHPVLSFTPRKQSYSPLHPTLPLPHLPPPLLSFDPPLQPRWRDDREGRESGEGGGREERKRWQLFNKCGGLEAREREECCSEEQLLTTGGWGG